MTDEILNKAHDYARNHIERTEEGDYDIIEEMRLVDAYLAGTEDNSPQWHYPSKGEFPEHEKDILGYWIGAGFCVGWYNEKQDLWLKNPLHSEWLIQPDAWQYLPEPPKEVLK